MSALIEIHDLRVRRGRHLALEVPQLIIEKGEVLAVVGPNGAGKSTLLLVLARLLRPEHGEILFNGAPAAVESDLAYRRRIGLVMQDALLLDMSVRENIALGLHFRGLPGREIHMRVEVWLERLGIAHLRDRRAGRLSGGESQRVALARAFVLEPDLLLLDEPFSALDSPTRASLLDDLQRLLAETSTTTVFVTHDFQDVARFARRVAVVMDGQLREAGTAESILSGSPSPGVVTFLRGLRR